MSSKRQGNFTVAMDLRWAGESNVDLCQVGKKRIPSPDIGLDKDAEVEISMGSPEPEAWPGKSV